MRIAANQSLLEAIRTKEATVTRRIVVAQQAAELTLAQAHQEGEEQIAAAIERGRLEGDAEGQRRVKQAERDAAAILSTTQATIQTWQATIQPDLETAITHALAVVLGQSKD